MRRAARRSFVAMLGQRVPRGTGRRSGRTRCDSAARRRRGVPERPARDDADHRGHHQRSRARRRSAAKSTVQVCASSSMTPRAGQQQRRRPGAGPDRRRRGVRRALRERSTVPPSAPSSRKNSRACPARRHADAAVRVDAPARSSRFAPRRQRRSPRMPAASCRGVRGPSAPSRAPASLTAQSTGRRQAASRTRSARAGARCPRRRRTASARHAASTMRAVVAADREARARRRQRPAATKARPMCRSSVGLQAMLVTRPAISPSRDDQMALLRRVAPAASAARSRPAAACAAASPTMREAALADEERLVHLHAPSRRPASNGLVSAVGVLADDDVALLQAQQALRLDAERPDARVARRPRSAHPTPSRACSAGTWIS